MVDTSQLFQRAAAVAATYRATVAERPVATPVELDALRAAFGGPLPIDGAAPSAVLDALVAAAEPGLVGSVGPRYFGFVIGGALDAATAAEMLAAGWDQNAFNHCMSPAALAAEDAAGTWLKQLLGLPPGASVGFVTGAQQANTVGLAAARHHVLAEVGWDVERDGLVGAPAVRVVGGEERHADHRPIAAAARIRCRHARAGRRRLQRGDRRRRPRARPRRAAAGADDRLSAGGQRQHRRRRRPARGRARSPRAHGAWVHVDGAFGLWAAANPATRHLVDGIELADSWACDGHKWLNVPYDSGYRLLRPPAGARRCDLATPRRISSAPAARGVARRPHARLVAAGTRVRHVGGDAPARPRPVSPTSSNGAAGWPAASPTALPTAALEVANDVVLNQVLAGFGDDARTDAVIDAVQRDGTCWLGGTTWRGRRLMRVSVSNATTTEDDVDRSVAAILRCAEALDDDV